MSNKNIKKLKINRKNHRKIPFLRFLIINTTLGEFKFKEWQYKIHDNFEIFNKNVEIKVSFY